ncbi:hypothetical protein [Streptomyces triticisoli]|uniref:hypothetical protein n=1 Tax=Streptomyces triticisoli TaxID=2182797 RepID=UPI001300197D
MPRPIAPAVWGGAVLPQCLNGPGGPQPDRVSQGASSDGHGGSVLPVRGFCRCRAPQRLVRAAPPPMTTASHFSLFSLFPVMPVMPAMVSTSSEKAARWVPR